MGGQGSGNWIRLGTKTIVKKCLSIDIMEFTGSMHRCISGEFQWVNAFGMDVSSVGYSFLPETDTAPMLILSYSKLDKIHDEVIELEKSILCSGGFRWWFTCPLCRTRTRIIYLPPNGQLFACRDCHKLAYGKSQKGYINF